MNEMNLKFNKMVYFSCQYNNFRIPEMLFDGLDVSLGLIFKYCKLEHRMILECVEVG